MSKSIIQDYSHRQCYLCGYLLGVWDENRNDLEEHHIMMGKWRALSEHYGLKVLLCDKHHRTTKEAVHRNADNELFLKIVAQHAFELKHSHELWMKEFGKNYLPSPETRATREPSEAPKPMEIKTWQQSLNNPFGD